MSNDEVLTVGVCIHTSGSRGSSEGWGTRITPVDDLDIERLVLCASAIVWESAKASSLGADPGSMRNELRELFDAFGIRLDFESFQQEEAKNLFHITECRR